MKLKYNKPIKKSHLFTLHVTKYETNCEEWRKEKKNRIKETGSKKKTCKLAVTNRAASEGGGGQLSEPRAPLNSWRALFHTLISIPNMNANSSLCIALQSLFWGRLLARSLQPYGPESKPRGGQRDMWRRSLMHVGRQHHSIACDKEKGRLRKSDNVAINSRVIALGSCSDTLFRFESLSSSNFCSSTTYKLFQFQFNDASSKYKLLYRYYSLYQF